MRRQYILPPLGYHIDYYVFQENETLLHLPLILETTPRALGELHARSQITMSPHGLSCTLTTNAHKGPTN